MPNIDRRTATGTHVDYDARPNAGQTAYELYKRSFSGEWRASLEWDALNERTREMWEEFAKAYSARILRDLPQ